MKTRILFLTSACALLVSAAHAQNAPPAPPVPGKATNAPATTKKGLELLAQKLATTNAPARPIPTRVVPTTLGKTNAPTITTTTTATTPTSTTTNATPGIRVPSLATGGAAGTKTNAPAIPGADLIVKASTIRFQNAEMFQVLDVYAELVGRTIIRPANLPNSPISIRAQTDLTKEEAIQALDSVFALNGIAIIPTGEKFLTVVPSAQANQEGAPFSIKDAKDLPEASQYITKVVQLKYIHPSEVVPVITPFAKNPTGIVPIESSSVLVLRDFAINIKRMLEVIEKVDKIVPLEENFEVIPIKYALAADISSVLNSLSGGSGGVTTPAGGASRTGARTTARGSNRNSTLPGATGGGGIPGQPGGGGIPGQPGGAAQPNAAFQNRLNQIVQRAAGAGAGGTAPLLGDAKLIPDERMNSILVFANKQDMDLVKNIIAKIDVIQPQVLIEAIILEVSLDNGKTLGVSAAQSQKKFGGNFSGFGGSKNGLFQSATNLANNNSLPNGFSYFGQMGKNWEVALQAIATDNTVNVLSRPRIQTSHAETATLFIGDTVPYITGTYFGGVNSGSSSQYQQKEVGINLSVLPLINTDGLVVMDISQNIEQLGTPQTIDGNQVPTTTKRTAAAKVMVQDGETIILGGFISSTKSKSKSGIPYLKDIPYLGALFRTTTDTNKRVELIVLMRPTVLKTPQDASLAATVERERLSGVQRAEMEISEEEKKLADKNKSKMKRMKSQDAKNPPATSVVPPPPTTRIDPPAPDSENK